MVPDAIRPINRQQPPPVELVAAMTALGRGEPLDADYPQSRLRFWTCSSREWVRIDLDLIRQQRCTGCANFAPTVLLNRSLECLERREDFAGIMPRAPLQTAATKPAATAEDRRPAPSVRALVSGSPAPL